MAKLGNRLRRVMVGMLLFAAAGIVHAAGQDMDPLSDQVRPRPSMTPQQVVQAQLAALRRNRADDRGIEVAFRFASPSNKRSTGPLPRFARMIKDGPYALMLRYLDASFSPEYVDGDAAAQRVTLIGASQAVTYVFYLSRQREDGPLNGCWMTDAVTIIPTPARPT